MKPIAGVIEITHADIVAIHARAQQMRAEAMAKLIRTLSRTIARGWAGLAHRSHRLSQ